MSSLHLTDILHFEWDKGNLEHIKKHIVSYDECETIFYDNPIFFEDKKHSTHEKRYLVFGTTNEQRLLTMVFTFRSDKVRIISARDQHRKEIALYLLKRKKLS